MSKIELHYIFVMLSIMLISRYERLIKMSPALDRQFKIRYVFASVTQVVSFKENYIRLDSKPQMPN